MVTARVVVSSVLEFAWYYDLLLGVIVCFHFMAFIRCTIFLVR